MILDDIWTKNRDLHDLTLGGRLSRRLLGEVSVAVVTGSRPYVLKAGDLVARKPAASMTGMSILRADRLFRSVWVEDATFFADRLVGIGGRGLGGVGGGETEASEEVIDLALETLEISGEALVVSGKMVEIADEALVVTGKALVVRGEE